MSTWIPSETPPPPTDTAPGGGGLLSALLPAQYAKALASAAGLLIAYLEAYGATWHLVPAAIAIGATLGVYGVPNASPK